MKFEKFKPLKNFKYIKGWDRFALDYVNLSIPNSIYSLTKKIMYEIINKNIVLNEKSQVLDVGCGTGNDFNFFLSKKAHITAFDMSDGMLNKSYEIYKEQIKSKKIILLKGRLEDFDEAAIPSEKYDLIFSITGGFAYIDNTQLVQVFKILKTKLKPHGKIITAHFNRHCLFESLFYLLRLRFKLSNQRNKDQIKVNIKDEKMTMHLYSVQKILNLFSENFKEIKVYPLLALTPPYQTGYKPIKSIFNIHKSLEMKILEFPFFAKIADQIAIVISNE